MINNLLKLILLLFSTSTSIYAQEYIRLDESTFELTFPETPFEKLSVLKNGKQVTLPQGKYIVPRNKITGLSDAFVTINKDGLIDGSFKIIHTEGSAQVKATNGMLKQFRFHKEDNLQFEMVFTDSTTTARDFTGPILTTELFTDFTKKHQGKQISKHVYDDEYIIDNKITNIYSKYYLNDKPKLIEKRAEKNGVMQIIDRKDYDEHGQVSRHTYLKKDIEYHDRYENNTLINRNYEINSVKYQELFKAGKLSKKIVIKYIDDEMETKTYNGLGKLIKVDKTQLMMINPGIK